ncbi:MAG: hypothetical protein AB3N64_02140 [Puniceicoccaceae bacterium]
MELIPQGESLLIQGGILALAILSLLVSWWAGRAGSPILAIASRWLRWIFIAILMAGAVYVFGWTGYRFPVLFFVAMLAWFLVETAYNWLAISTLSRSELPLFPKFEENDSGEEWPTDNRFLKLKDWLSANGFSRRQALISHLEDLVLMRVSVYENQDQTIRLHVLFLPNARGSTAVCFTCYSSTRLGDCIVTDNVFLPFGGFYPENWDVERRPWTRALSNLVERHRARIDAKAEVLMPFVTSPLEQINEDQRQVELLNRDLGFLNKRAEETELGRLTTAGKARIWQEIWTLAYFGLPLSYN